MFDRLKPQKIKIFAALTVVFALLAVIFEGLGADSLFSYNALITMGVYLGLCALFTVLFLCSASVLLKAKYTKKKASIITCAFSALIFTAMILLLGYYVDVWHAVVNCVLVSAFLIYSFGVAFAKRAAVFSVASFLLLSTIAVCLGCLEPIVLSIRNKTVELAEYEYGEKIFPYASEPEKVLVYKTEGKSSEYEAVLNSVQGYLAANSKVQVLYDWPDTPYESNYCISTTEEMVGYIKRYYPHVQIEYIYEDDVFFDAVMPLVCGFVRYNVEDVHSTAVAYTMSGILNSIILDDKVVGDFSKYNLSELFDARNKDENWLLSSEYMEKVNKNFIFYQRCCYPVRESIYSYVQLTKGLVVSETDSISVLKKYLKVMNRGAIMFGKAGDLTESAVVTATARYSITFIYETTALNFAALSGFRLENAIKPETSEKGVSLEREKRDLSGEGQGKHSLCIMLSDGDNVRVSTEVNFNCEWERRAYDESSLAYYHNDMMHSTRRGADFGMNFGISGAMVEVAPIYMLAYKENLLENEDMVLQISSLGYTYPSKWKDSEAWQQVIKRLDYLLDITDTSVVEIMDYTEFMAVASAPFELNYMRPYFDTYTSLDSVDGCLYISYMGLYAGYKGEVCWSNGKPVVSAKYSLWNDTSFFHTKANEPDYIAEQINNSSTDCSSEDAYTFVIVHIWSGSNEDGTIIPNGNVFEMINQLVENLDEDVELVTATEFVNRMSKNIKNKK